MKIHHIRNATMVIESDNNYILIDPMLGPKGSLPPFSLFRSRPRKNPTIELPENAWEIINKTTHCLITHLHPDHLDNKGENFLRKNNIPVICSAGDLNTLKKKSFNITQIVDYHKTTPFLNGEITGIPAKHGYGFIARLMGNVMGFLIDLDNEPSVYLSSDTVYTTDVKRVLEEFRPGISVVAAGSAQFDLFQPLLMNKRELLKFTIDSPGQVIANHLESVNHCPTTRKELFQLYNNSGLSEKTWIPEDGEYRIYKV
ncbi:MBL fold metallo-hydrolase [Mangrovivirga cuniculi]|uniref:MBL fold metallo-hydrolase n=1 Tax=Mangrovivirga cuniculi TaxID=2715131 RepID=A0A4D7JY99_9BACT|nr:MBL fold metallo-hydrolase [Mangrovivirga cuniculi]QCK15665.1 MBL fold metallo-hydrolase [Mangrovivirga cuniculi]